MPIPETQLETWSHQGSIAQSSNTYNTIKNTLEAKASPYEGKGYTVFLQGSYGNDTNIYSESDVDIVIVLNDCFHSDLSALPDEQKSYFETSYANATYTRARFKQDVIQVLTTAYGADVSVGEKAIAIAANGNRRKADVIAAAEYRRYYKCISSSDQSYDTGICFCTNTGEQIANYPKQHSDNLTSKHQTTSRRFKPMARIFKNIRSKLVDEGILRSDVAPSYYLEGLLYNVPNEIFVSSYGDTFVDAINWLRNANRDDLVCANEQYRLLHASSPVTWRVEKCDMFINSAINLWNNW